jgi:hypothetical protein
MKLDVRYVYKNQEDSKGGLFLACVRGTVHQLELLAINAQVASDMQTAQDNPALNLSSHESRLNGSIRRVLLHCD